MATNKMATSKILTLILLLVSAAAWSREVASTSCQGAAAQPAIANGKAVLERNPSDLRALFGLADAWSDAGCFNDALQVLQSAHALHPGNKELETRLRVAKSLVGEEHFFDNLDRANAEAKLKRDTFRCTSLADLEACNAAVRMKPDDPALLVAQRDALARAKPPADAATPATEAGGSSAGSPPQIAAAPTQRNAAPKLRVAHATVAEMPMRRYSNAAPESRSH